MHVAELVISIPALQGDLILRPMIVGDVKARWLASGLCNP
jgi:hypothetical protein